MPKRIQIYYRKGSWEVKKGLGRWRFKYTGDNTEKQVKDNLRLEYPTHQIIRWRKPTNGVK